MAIDRTTKQQTTIVKATKAVAEIVGSPLHEIDGKVITTSYQALCKVLDHQIARLHLVATVVSTAVLDEELPSYLEPDVQDTGVPVREQLAVYVHNLIDVVNRNCYFKK